MARRSGEGEPAELAGLVMVWDGPGGGGVVRGGGGGGAVAAATAAAAAAFGRKPGGNCWGHWLCQRWPRFRAAAMLGRWAYIWGMSRSPYGAARPHICRCWRAFSSRAAWAPSGSWPGIGPPPPN